MQRIAVLDFETANHQPNSACQLGVVHVEDWQIVREKMWMIRPQRLYFSPRCIAVHGIKPEDVAQAPTWEEIWSEVLEWTEDFVVVAHNAGFDANVFRSTSASYDLAVPPIDLQCTRLIAKRTWPALKSHALAAMAEFLSIRFQHHHALEDARASAEIMIRSASKLGVQNIEELEDSLGLVRGRIWGDRVSNPRTVRRSRLERVEEPGARYEPKRFRKDGTPMTEGRRRGRVLADEILLQCKNNLPLQGKHLVLIGTLLGMDREDSVSFLKQLGGEVQREINLQTDYVIQGTETAIDGTETVPSSSADGGSPASGIASVLGGLLRSRRGEIDKRESQGQPIRILSQRQLLALIPAGLQVARGGIDG